jgi:hypothetical protein
MRILTMAVLSAIIAFGGAQSVSAAATIPVNCTADAGALGSALVTAADGDTLLIQGTCNGTYDISRSLTFSGNGGATLNGQGAGTVLVVERGATVGLNDLTITGGHTDITTTFAGGIQNGGTLTLTNTLVEGNSASVPHFRNGAGGIGNQGGSVTLVNSTVRGNIATATEAFDTTVGGIVNFCCGSSITLSNSTVSGNSASSPSDAFGGILNSAPGSIVTSTNSTISGNSASAPGGPSAFSAAVGGISNSGGTTSLTNTTIASNTVDEPNGGFTPPVGGVSNFFGGTLTITNSLIAKQTGGPNCFGPNNDGGYNLDDGTTCAFSAANHSLSSVDPLLDPAGLADNGGPTQTIALLSGSPAIDVIPPATNGCGTSIAADQRGVSRPQGSGCDTGAFEFVLQTLTVAIDIKPGEVPNPINPRSTGATPVAVLSTPTFNAPAQVDTSSLRFGHTGNETSLVGCSPPQDVNGDGRPDVLCRFSTQKAAFQSGDVQGVLTGKTIDGTPIRGTDSVVIVPT